jgi:hypothetical protein
VLVVSLNRATSTIIHDARETSFEDTRRRTKMTGGVRSETDALSFFYLRLKGGERAEGGWAIYFMIYLR